MSARAKISLEPRITLTFLDIMLETPPKENILQQPGLSLISAPRASAGSRLVLADVVLWGPLCFNASDRPPDSARPVPRPDSEPGKQNFTDSLPQTGCSSSAAAMVLQRCWADRTAWYDFALEGRYIDATGTQRPNNYTVRMLNLTYLCRRMLTAECIAASGGSSRCYLREINNGTLPPLDLGEITVVAPAPAPPADSGSSSGSDGGDTTLAIVLGCVIGGVALLSVAALAVWWRHRSQRRRQQQQQQQQREQEKLQGGTGAVALHLSPQCDGAGGQVADAEAAVVQVGNGGSGGAAARWLCASGGSGGEAAALCKGMSADMSGSGPLVSPGLSGGEQATPPHSGRGVVVGAGVGMGVGMGAALVHMDSSKGALEHPLQSTTTTATHTSAGADSSRSTLLLPLGACVSPLPGGRPPGLPAGGGGPSFRNIHVQELAGQCTSPGSTRDRTGATDVVVAATPYQPSLVLQLEVDESALAVGGGGDEASATASAAFGAYGYSSQIGAPSSVAGSGAAAALAPYRLLHQVQAPQPHPQQPHPQQQQRHYASGSGLRTSGSGTLPAAMVVGSPGASGARPLTGTGAVGGRGASRLGTMAAVDVAAGGRRFNGSSTGLVDVGVGAASGSGPWDAASLGGGASLSGGESAAPNAHTSALSPSPGTGGAGGANPSGGADVVTLLPVVRGRGAFGRVTEGLWRGQRVAVKQMLGVHDGAAAGQSDLAKSFKQEVEVLGRCAHPNVVKLLAASLAPPRLCLVMELCETSLERLLFGRGPEPEPLPLGKVLHIAIQICQGLAYLHPTIVHRDLKPANVLINGAESDRPTAKLTDFGLSRMRAATLPTMEPEAGTTTYLAPECFDVDNAVITHQADMYSLGVVLWTMLAAREPWKDQSIVAVAFKVSQGLRLPLDGLGAGRCPPKLRRLVESLWEQDPLRRPAAAEVLKLLVMIQEQLDNPGSTGLPTAGSLGLNPGSRPLIRMQPDAQSASLVPGPARALSSAASLLLPGGATQQAGPGWAQQPGGQSDGQQRVLAAPQHELQLQLEAAAAVAAMEERGSAQNVVAAAAETGSEA
ncbi:hypothetical protein HXX76_012078 [Chlamydomonas incerta]|uniref:Protein kinase domain-containing protein n=1 Tax=Chlamydomonas incerta TaxID=51695 RepID=A0A835VVW0_CHLIN|nr:hypothetical protein HXX76_012078 [Chlamydomonas incerta]|eukprot:KAG2427753.1 hypothetical protein HXX76_012078 [Chlamydomonas incerta]